MKPTLALYNSLSRTTSVFKPHHFPSVSLYTCGMTVYDYAHIGHGRKYVGDDILRRTLEYLNFKVKHVQNVTDVGHLVSDKDEGEDKLEKGARKTGKTVWEIAQYFTNHFYSSMDQLNILRPDIICRATEHIPDQIDLIKKLFKKGFAYDTPEAVYFDISKFDRYNRLFPQKLSDKQTAVRSEVKTGEHKKTSTDFALWFKRVGRFSDHVMHWNSPWGEGFPGWHIECSAMSMKYLGNTIDIHTGGIDHLSVHHPNEIAQSETATGKPFVRFWVHHGFLMVDGRKMSKSLGNIYTIEDIIQKGYEPLALRYLYLTGHYRKPLNFTFEALDNTSRTYQELHARVLEIINGSNIDEKTDLSKKAESILSDFEKAITNDLNMPQALAGLWEMIRSDISKAEKHYLFKVFNEVLGLFNKNSLQKKNIPKTEIPKYILDLARKRDNLRINKKFFEADKIRDEIIQKGYKIEDTAFGTIVTV